MPWGVVSHFARRRFVCVFSITISRAAEELLVVIGILFFLLEKRENFLFAGNCANERIERKIFRDPSNGELGTIHRSVSIKSAASRVVCDLWMVGI